MFKSSIPLGRIAGIPVGAHWSVLIIMALLADLLAVGVLEPMAPGRPAWVHWLIAAATAVVFLASLVAHEVAHALTGRHFRLRTKCITLWMLGGVAQFDGEPPSPKADALVAVSGPLASLALGGMSYGLAELAARTGLSAMVVAALVWIAFTNGILAVFNLLPATPLDGGRVLRALVWKRTGDRRRAVEVAARSGQAVGAVLVVLGILPLVYGRFDLLPTAVVGWFIMVAAAAEAAASRLSGLRAADVLRPDPTVAPGWWTVRAFLDHVAAGSPHRVFPVVTFEGKVAGVVCLAELARLTTAARVYTRVDKACRGLAAVPVVRPEDQLDRFAFGSGLREGRDLVLVLRDEHLAGVIGPNDIARAIELCALGEPLHGHSPDVRA